MLGAFYTPSWAVEYMLSLVRPENLNGQVLEPAGGDGAFLHGLLAKGCDPANSEVWDINPLVENPLRSLGCHVYIGDALYRSEPEPRFDLAIGNPPYLNKASSYISENKAYLRRAFREIGASEAYAMFTYLSGKCVRPGGQVVMLLSDTFLTLGLHRRFREWLLSEMTIDSITLLPADTFPEASVNTCVLAFTVGASPAGHQVAFRDARELSGRNPHAATTVRVPQSALAAAPGSVLAFDADARQALALLDGLPALMDLLDGGLGMYTGDNKKYLAVVTDQGVPRTGVGPGSDTIEAVDVDGKDWRFYHKRGGERRWFGSAEHAIRWDEQSQKAYTIPDRVWDALAPKSRVAVSGISAMLSARLATPTAAWESNKVFVLTPKNPSAYPAEFFIAVLNSDRYNRIVRALNHTVSLQVRDLRSLPLLPFTAAEVKALAKLGSEAIGWAAGGGDGVAPQQDRIDTIVNTAYSRAVAAASKKAQAAS